MVTNTDVIEFLAQRGYIGSTGFKKAVKAYNTETMARTAEEIEIKNRLDAAKLEQIRLKNAMINEKTAPLISRVNVLTYEQVLKECDDFPTLSDIADYIQMNRNTFNAMPAGVKQLCRYGLREIKREALIGREIITNFKAI